SNDFNGDGFSDLAVACTSGVSILLGTGTGSFGSGIVYPAGTGAYSVTTGDFNLDWKIDLAVANTSAGNVSILLGTGTGSFGSPTNYAVGSFPYSVVGADFNGDGRLDLATTNQGSANVSVLLGGGTGSFSATINFGVGTAPVSIVSSDFNGDGRLDIATANNTSNDASVLLSTADSLSGIIHTALGIPVNSGKVHLFREEINHRGLYDTAGVTPLNPNGTYAFSSLLCNNYLLKVIADTIAFPNSIGTYYSTRNEAYQWDSAVVINHNACNGGNNTGKNVNILEITPSSGPGSIFGQITEGVGYGQKLIGGNLVLTPGGPVRGVDVKLGKNPGGQAAARTSTDINGNYHFSNLPLGNYKIYVDVPNYPMDSVLAVTLSSATPTVANSNYYVDSIKVRVNKSSSIKSLHAFNNQEVILYPNPTSGTFTIETSTTEKQILQIYDVTGKMILSQNVSGTSTIDASGLSEGVYNVSILGKEGVSNKRLVIVR
ncbi:MAG TPA: FG-GAP-like repeat-containing protein, partial [Nitrosopumilaceae archaeon]|nr:FG-GAP-like repeat-containing protein [Nitrosopumilaceae archaeon]